MSKCPRFNNLLLTLQVLILQVDLISSLRMKKRFTYLLFSGVSVCTLLGCANLFNSMSVEDRAKEYAVQLQHAMAVNHRDSISMVSDDARDWLSSLSDEDKVKADSVIRVLGKEYVDSVLTHVSR